MFNITELRNVLKNIDNILEEKCVVVGVGGTGMVLRGIKNSTEDVDFTIREGYSIFVRAINHLRLQHIIDSWIDGEIYLNNLPSDYFRKSKFEFSFEKLNVHSLSPVDIIITKIGRLNQRDRIDIESMIRHENMSPEEIVNRSKELDYGGLHTTYFDNFRQVMADNFQVDINSII